MDRKMDVLALLKAQGSATLAEIATHLGVSKQGALRHLESMQAKGLVEVGSEEHHGPGRPEHSYRLTEAAGERFPSGHRELASELVDFIEADELDRFFAQRAARMEEEYSAAMAGLDFDGKVRELARLAREHGHMTELVEVAGSNPQLRHCNCPIQDVAARTGLPCQYELDLYRRLLDAEVVRTSWVGSGDTNCTYEITTTAQGRKRIG